jgi:uncharacterized membrane protein
MTPNPNKRITTPTTRGSVAFITAIAGIVTIMVGGIQVVDYFDRRLGENKQDVGSVVGSKADTILQEKPQIKKKQEAAKTPKSKPPQQAASTPKDVPPQQPSASKTSKPLPEEQPKAPPEKKETLDEFVKKAEEDFEKFKKGY